MPPTRPRPNLYPITTHGGVRGGAHGGVVDGLGGGVHGGLLSRVHGEIHGKIYGGGYKRKGDTHGRTDIRGDIHLGGYKHWRDITSEGAYIWGKYGHAGVYTRRRRTYGVDVHKEGTDTEGTDTGPIDTGGATHGGDIHPEPRAAKLLPISMHFCRTYF